MLTRLEKPWATTFLFCNMNASCDTLQYFTRCIESLVLHLKPCFHYANRFQLQLSHIDTIFSKVQYRTIIFTNVICMGMKFSHPFQKNKLQVKTTGFWDVMPLNLKEHGLTLDHSQCYYCHNFKPLTCLMSAFISTAIFSASSSSSDSLSSAFSAAGCFFAFTMIFLLRASGDGNKAMPSPTGSVYSVSGNQTGPLSQHGRSKLWHSVV